jgi:hypothetical protein
MSEVSCWTKIPLKFPEECVCPTELAKMFERGVCLI